MMWILACFGVLLLGLWLLFTVRVVKNLLRAQRLMETLGDLMTSITFGDRHNRPEREIKKIRTHTD